MQAGTRAADLRFVLPAPPRTAVVIGAPDVSAALTQAGIAVRHGFASSGGSSEAVGGAGHRWDGEPAGDGSAIDLAVVTRRSLGEALAEGPASIVVTGAIGRVASRRLEGAGYGVTRLLVRHGPAGPRLLVPVRGPALRHALVGWFRPPSALRAARNEIVARLAASGARLPGAMLTLASRAPGPPWPVSAAAGLGIPAGPDTSWSFSPGFGDELQRAAFYVFAPHDSEPSWVVKLSRSAGNEEPFAADERGLRLAAGAGPVAAAHVPLLLGRIDLGGLPASVESAAPGRPMQAVLAARGARDAKLSAIDAVARWVIDVGVETAGTSGEFDRERDRVATLSDAAAGTAAALPPVPAVLAHNDLGTWNIAYDRRSRDFTVLDWESARRPAMPLWDLLYFLTDALVALDRHTTPDAQVRAALALLRGEHAASAALFGWVRCYADALGLPGTAPGPLATLCWIHHASSRTRREASLAEHSAGTPPPAAELGFLARLAGPWLSDPALGTTWEAWKQAP